MTNTRYHIQARDDEEEPWSSAALEDQVFDTIEEAEEAIERIRRCEGPFVGAAWALAEYRIVQRPSTAAIIATARSRADISQAEAAERVGVSQPAWAQWERGCRVPTWARLLDLVEACGCELRCAVAKKEKTT